MVREVARELAGTAAVVQVNTQENPHLAARFGIRGIPALVLLRQGQVLATWSGALPREAVLSRIRGALR